MSRLSRSKVRNKQRRLFFLSILAITITIFIAINGFSFLLRAGAFISDVARSEDAEPTQDAEEVIGILALDKLSTATNSASIIVSGQVSRYDTLEFYINNTKVETQAAKSNFETEIGTLKDGENEIYVRAVTKDGKNSKKSDIQTITYIAKPPELEIAEPGNDTTVDADRIFIRGNTSIFSSVFINNSPAVVALDGSFTEEVRLKEGDNIFTIRAVDIAGNETKEELKVKYER